MNLRKNLDTTVADYIGHSLDYWTSDEQASRWNSLL